jgi:hypothetical protein
MKKPTATPALMSTLFVATLGITAEKCVEYVQRRMHEGDDEFRNA